MRKTPRILTVIATAISTLCLVALLVCIVLQKLLTPLLIAMPEALDRFVIPVGPVLYALGAFLILLMLCFATGAQKTGIWIEILGAVLLALLPSLQSGVTLLQNMLIGNYGAAQLAAFAAVSRLCAVPTGLIHFAVVLALIACGMSMAYKNVQKQITT